MQVTQFIKLLEKGIPFEDVKVLVGADLKDAGIDKDASKLFKILKKMPPATFGDYRARFMEDVAEYTDKWKIELKDADTWESVTDFSENTGERVKISSENYQTYFDSILSNEEDTEEHLALEIEIYSKNRKKSFKAKMRSTSAIAELNKERAWVASMSFHQQEFLFLLNYLNNSDPGPDWDISIAEAVARGQIINQIFMVTGQFLNKNLTKLFNDFF